MFFKIENLEFFAFGICFKIYFKVTITWMLGSFFFFFFLVNSTLSSFSRLDLVSCLDVMEQYTFPKLCNYLGPCTGFIVTFKYIQ